MGSQLSLRAWLTGPSCRFGATRPHPRVDESVAASAAFASAWRDGTVAMDPRRQVRNCALLLNNRDRHDTGWRAPEGARPPPTDWDLCMLVHCGV